MAEDQIQQKFGNRLRVRVCGLCWQNERLLMINHRGLRDGDFWAPPGGGVDFGEKVTDTLMKEFLEETRLIIKPGKYLFGCEFIRQPLHAIELFFEADYVDGNPTQGHDPELEETNQIITTVKFMKMDEIMALKPEERHGIFEKLSSVEMLKNSSGFYSI